jgi:hypothetical protein
VPFRTERLEENVAIFGGRVIGLEGDARCGSGAGS